MKNADAKNHEWKLDELARQSSVPARTIRYYIARGVLPAPLRPGRGAAYGQEHLAALQRIRDMQARGLTLSQIARQMGTQPPDRHLPEPSGWWMYPVADDVIVWLRADAPPWRLKQVREGLARLAQEIHQD